MKTVKAAEAPDTTSQVSADDLLVALTVARSGSFNAAAGILGVTHTTVSRRVSNLEKALRSRVFVRASEGWVPTETGQTVITAAEEIERALGRLGQTGQVATVVRVGAPDGLSSFCVAPAMARLARERPQFSFELISATRSWRQTRSDLDIEIVIGRPEVNNRADMVHVRDYSLALYATEPYLQEHGEPESLLDLTNHTVIYYIDSALQVDDLDKATDLLPQSAKAIRSTSVHVHVQSAVASAGIGLLPDYLAEREPGLRPVLHHQFRHPLSYWAVIRRDSYRNPMVQLALREIMREAASGAVPRSTP